MAICKGICFRMVSRWQVITNWFTMNKGVNTMRSN